MAGENTVSTLNGLFKVVYADKLHDLVPEFAILQKKIDFSPADKETGNYYAQPVALSQEGGFTYNGEAGSVVSLESPVNMTLKEAQVKGTELILRSQIAYTALSRASKAGPKAFKRASGFLVEGMNSAMRKRLELSMLYGRVGVGRVSSVSSNTITVTDKSWSAAIWAGTEGHIIEVFSGITGSDTKRSVTDGTITAVDTDAKTITVTNIGSGVTANDYIFFKGARTATAWNEMAGLQAILTNSGTLFNIDASAYSLWSGNDTAVSGDLTFQVLQEQVCKAVNKGALGKMLVLVSPKGWSRLNTDLSALRQLDASYSTSKGENGVEGIRFHGVNGEMEVLSHPFVKEGDCFIIPADGESSALRIGSVDVTFGVPGMSEEFFTLVSGKNAVELQCMADQAIFLPKPAHALYLSDVTYS